MLNGLHLILVGNYVGLYVFIFIVSAIVNHTLVVVKSLIENLKNKLGLPW